MTRKMLNKKAQFKIQQMTFMIAGVFIFFILAGLFVVSIQFSNIRKSAEALQANQAVSIAQYLVESPEFTCAAGSYCIDTDKLIVLMNRTAYKNFWPVAYIKVLKIYPSGTGDCTLKNYPNCNLYNVMNTGIQSTSSTSSFVALCRHENDESIKTVCDLGKIIIGYKV
jgi:hypothetical protein